MSHQRIEIGRIRWSRRPRGILIGLGVVIALILSLSIASGVYTNTLWFESFGFRAVYMKMLVTRIAVGMVIGVLVFLFFLVNLALVRRISVLSPEMSPLGRFLSSKASTHLVWILSLIGGLMASGTASSRFMTFLKFHEREPFNVLDPIFGKDLGFYIFSLPLLEYFYRLLLIATIVTIVLSAAIYFASIFTGRRFSISRPAKVHLSALLCLFFLAKAWGFRLDTYNLLFSARGVVFGASYTDIAAQLPAYRILMVGSLLCALAVIVGAFARGFKFAPASLAALFVCWITLGMIYPALVQRLRVEPNEIAKESPFIERNIAFTRKAYGLDAIEERNFEVSGALSVEDLDGNTSTLRNIRLWDYRPLEQTYQQLQGIRLYYDFTGVDIDRYTIGGIYTEVMLAAREINIRKLPARARTWVNEHLKYTHGYGLCMSPVNEVSEEGMPSFLIKDIPPRSVRDLEAERPEIYFGELTDQYVLVNTRTEEFDYPKGDQNAYTRYSGSGGVPLSSFVRKLAFAWRFKSLKMLLSSDIESSSRILYDRNIKRLTEVIAPFLMFDSDPYLILDSGKLFWIQDAYTFTDGYPYSEPIGGLRINYVRNSVKITIDAYTGETHFYIFDDLDPVCKVYRKIFPDLFKPRDQMPGSLLLHIRYPEQLYLIQASILNTYHMKDPQVFYNKEDLWSLPAEVYAEEPRIMEPYYVIMKLPDEDKTKFILMMPFTPVNKNNMIAWMAAHCDPDSYGELVIYKFPKQKLVYGPMQIEARIDQDPEISRQLTLWGQKGSRVIRGNLLVIPIEDDLLYVEPLYIHAEQSQLPELKRVIVSHGGRIAMQETLESALEVVFSGRRRTVSAAEVGEEAIPYALEDLSRLLAKAKERLAAGDWGGFGQAMEELEEAIRTMREHATQEQ